jgi:hypothetical protein
MEERQKNVCIEQELDGYKDELKVSYRNNLELR